MNTDEFVGLMALFIVFALFARGVQLLSLLRVPRRIAQLLIIGLESLGLAIIFLNTLGFRFSPPGSPWHAMAYMDDIRLLFSLELQPYYAIDWNAVPRVAAALFVIGFILIMFHVTGMLGPLRMPKQAKQNYPSILAGYMVAWVVTLGIGVSRGAWPFSILFWVLVVTLVLLPSFLKKRGANKGVAARTSDEGRVRLSPLAVTFLVIAICVNVVYWKTALVYPLGAFLLSGYVWIFFASVLFLDAKEPH